AKKGRKEEKGSRRGKGLLRRLFSCPVAFRNAGIWKKRPLGAFWMVQAIRSMAIGEAWMPLLGHIQSARITPAEAGTPFPRAPAGRGPEPSGPGSAAGADGC